MDTNFFAAAVLDQIVGHKRLRGPRGEVFGWLQRNLLGGRAIGRLKYLYCYRHLSPDPGHQTLYKILTNL